MASAQLATQTPSAILIIMLVALLVLGVTEVFALYFHLARFTVFEIILLLALPFFFYLTALPVVASTLLAGDVAALKTMARLLDVPLLHFDNATLGFNLVGFSIPVFISVKMLLQKRIPVKESLLLVAIISVVSFLYTYFEPDKGMVIYMFAILPILAAAIAFMLKKMKGASDFNSALLSYAGATLGMLIGADVSNLYRALTYRWGETVVISVGGGSILDAIFLAGIVALFADLVFRTQEENVFGGLAKLFTGHRHR